MPEKNNALLDLPEGIQSYLRLMVSFLGEEIIEETLGDLGYKYNVDLDKYEQVYDLGDEIGQDSPKTNERLNN